MQTTAIEEAREFVMNSVQNAAMQSALPKQIKNKVKNSEIWLSRFKRVGDLLHYLRRFKPSNDDPTYRALKEHNLLTFEDILPEFEQRFGPWAHDRTRASDFVIGEEYSAYDILIFSNTYDTRAGGMFVLDGSLGPAAVVIKATLQDGRYPNQWIQPELSLKYYLKSIDGDFNVRFKTNAAIINHPHVPILTFVREHSGARFRFSGIFRYRELVVQPDGAKYFVLDRSEQQPTDVVESFQYVQDNLALAVQKSQQLSSSERLQRLAVAPKKPKSIQVISSAFSRNPDVIAEVLARASGRCERCNTTAPFLKKSDGTPYLEVHHKVPLSKDGDDTVANAIALCPNCHRALHFG